MDKLSPTTEQKDKMLSHILFHSKALDKVESHDLTTKQEIKKKKKINTKYLFGVAACLIGLIISTDGLSQRKAPQHAPITNSPDQITQYLYYKNAEYIEIGLVDESMIQLVSEIGMIERLVYSSEELEDSELAATIGLGGTVWEIAEYDKEFRVVLEYKEAYYLFENTAVIID